MVKDYLSPPNPPPKRRVPMGSVKLTKEEKDELKKDLDKVFNNLSQTFDRTFERSEAIFKKSDRIFDRADQRMRDAEKRLRKRMSDTESKVKKQQAYTRSGLGNYDFTVDRQTAIKQLTRNLKIKTALIGLFLCGVTLFAIIMILLSTRNIQTTNQQLNPPSIEETTTIEIPKQL